ncbi:hypothetical protein [Simiduia aestuariiviva]|uniref:Thioredoxin domain-containing protein n=1 Tax=Simiduia aestuariiviva TaxID=1510459 RepID=A0A839UTL1_9GAMM|nr:hypothetical protein [Simiduia aestuariiviva]MBB3169790.1 hypothetical protein [Simiduia aestuariiviva]
MNESVKVAAGPVNGVNRWAKILIVSTIVLPMVIAYGVYHTGLGMPTGTINKGDLLAPPVNIEGLTLTIENQSAAIDQIEPKWRLVIPAFNVCEIACEQALYVTRQVHKRLNEKYPRVERWILTNIDDEKFITRVATEYPGAVLVSALPDQWQTLLSNTNSKDGDYFMMDRSGFVMMSYQTSVHSGNDLLKDLKRMLKFTREH